MTSAERLAVLNWVKAALSIEAIFSPSAGPRPSEPYATVEVLSERSVGAPDKETVDDGATDGSGELSITTQRRGTLSVSIYAEQHRELSTQLELSVHDPARQDALAAAGVVIVGAIGTSDYNRVNRPTSFEGFSVVDFEYARVSTLATRGPVLETVEIRYGS